MIKPQEIIEELKVIKQAINLIEIKGEQNANNLLFACQKCDMLVGAIEVVISKTTNKQNKVDTEAVEAGE